MSKWYKNGGEKSEVVVSTRVRLARNLEEYPFPAKLDSAGKKQINNLVKDALLGNTEDELSFIEMESLSRAQTISLAERHLISPEFTGSGVGHALLLSDDESVSIMLCEEDHIRIQVMEAGLALDSAYERADRIDNVLSARLPLAFDERIGYLTQCPTNLGTAMRASVMLHLPALGRSGQIAKISATVSKLGLIIRGCYGEGSSPNGDLYQLSNQVTLGISEKTAIDNLKSITQQLVSQELAMRERMLNNPVWEDKVYRSLGILKSARLLSCEEFMNLASLVRMGAAQGIFDIPTEKIGELFVDMQPATINAREGKNLEASQRDAIRAKAVREALC
ncbi:MAG TPA: protein arginine kinase [Ruminococcaceae bacterium]|nr:protein arginine kinase [Oscillospiraceae bacterium]